MEAQSNSLNRNITDQIIKSAERSLSGEDEIVEQYKIQRRHGFIDRDMSYEDFKVGYQNGTISMIFV